MYSEPPRSWAKFLDTLKSNEAYSHMHKVYLAEHKRLQAEQLAAEIEQKNKKKRNRK